MKLRFTSLLGLVLMLVLASVSATGADNKVRVGVLKYGTVNWELKAIGFEIVFWCSANDRRASSRLSRLTRHASNVTARW